MNKRPLLVCAVASMAALLSGCSRIERLAVDLAYPAPRAAAVVEAPVATGATDIPAAAGHHFGRHADGLFYVDARANDRRLRFLVDTGASVVVLTAADARAIGVEIDDSRFTKSVETVGGSTAMAWTTIEQIQIAGHTVRGVRAAVVRNGLGVSLLGQNLMARLESVTISADRLVLR